MPLEDAIALSIGQRLGPYEILGALGSGGMGEVFRARDTRLRRDVALKVIHPALVKPEYVERFSREARAAAALNHPNILAVFDVSIEGPLPYVVSELLEGESLRARLDRGPLQYRKALEYGIQIAQALAAAHGKGIYHRDVKPANIFLTTDGRVKLLDFGLAKLAPLLGDPEDPTMTRHRPGHASARPATWPRSRSSAGRRPSDRHLRPRGGAVRDADGSRAFSRSSATRTMNAVVHEEPDDPLALNPSLSPAAAVAVRRCLEKNRDERFQSARDLAFHLHQLAQATTGSHPTPTQIRSGRRLMAALAVGVVALLPVLAWMISRPGPSPAFQQLTFHRGRIGGARFAGQTIVYSQARGLDPPEVSLRLSASPEARPLNYAADVLATRAGELALGLHRRFVGGERFVGTLALVPLGGGAPHEILDDVEDADCEAEGAEFVVARSRGLGAGSRLEYPVGRTLYETSGSLHHPRLSRDGRYVAVHEDPAGLGTAGRVVILGRDGRVAHKTGDWTGLRGLAWSPDGREVWFTAAVSRANRALRAVLLNGRERVVHEAPGSLTIWDAAPDGRVLLTREEERWRWWACPPAPPRSGTFPGSTTPAWPPCRATVACCSSATAPGCTCAGRTGLRPRRSDRPKTIRTTSRPTGASSSQPTRPPASSRWFPPGPASLGPCPSTASSLFPAPGGSPTAGASSSTAASRVVACAPTWSTAPAELPSP